MRIYVLVERQGPLWYPQNAIALFEATGLFDFTDDPAKADIIWIFAYYQPLDPIVEKDILFYIFKYAEKFRLRVIPRLRLKKALRSKVVISSFHHLYRPKEAEYIHRTRFCDAVSDHIQFFSEKNRQDLAPYFSKPLVCAPYWIDLKQFYPFTAQERAAARKKYALPTGKKIIGSFQRDTETDRRTPKLEKGPDIFCDIVEALDPASVHVFLAGPRREYVERRLGQKGITFTSVGDVGLAQMNELYQCLDLYLVTSRCEGGPQAIIECMAGKVPILSTDVGIADLLDPQAVLSEPKDFVAILKSGKYPDVIEQHYAAVQKLAVHHVAQEYLRLFNDKLNKGKT